MEVQVMYIGKSAIVQLDDTKQVNEIFTIGGKSIPWYEKGDLKYIFSEKNCYVVATKTHFWWKTIVKD